MPFVFYVGSYLILMDRNTVPVDNAGYPTSFKSTYRFAESMLAPDAQITFYVQKVCWLNYFFYPLDWVIDELNAI